MRRSKKPSGRASYTACEHMGECAAEKLVCGFGFYGDAPVRFLSSLLLSSLESSDTKVYAPQIQALFGTASHFYEVVLKLRIVRGPGRLSQSKKDTP